MQLPFEGIVDIIFGGIGVDILTVIHALIICGLIILGFQKIRDILVPALRGEDRDEDCRR